MKYILLLVMVSMISLVSCKEERRDMIEENAIEMDSMRIDSILNDSLRLDSINNIKLNRV